jgi:hypothetical protein
MPGRAILLQPMIEQRRPPPWLPHSMPGPGAADRPHPMIEHRRPPPCTLQWGVPPDRRVRWHPGVLHFILAERDGGSELPPATKLSAPELKLPPNVKFAPELPLAPVP